MRKKILRNRTVLSVTFLLMVLISTASFESMCNSEVVNQTSLEPLQHKPEAIESPPQPAWDHYHNYSEMVEILEALNRTYPSLVDLFPIGQSWQNRTIYCVKLTNQNLTLSKPKTLFVGYHHARELISAELPLYFVVWAVENYGSDDQITKILDFSEVYIVAALNVDGLEIIRGNDWQRKNARPTNEDGDGLIDEDPPSDVNRNGYVEALVNEKNESLGWEGIDSDGDGILDWIGGVDLNRNYSYAWNMSATSGSTNASDQDYKGPYPFSEPETQAIMNLTLQNDFKYAISFHSGGEIILYPWNCKRTTSPDDLTFWKVAVHLYEIVRVPFRQGGSSYYSLSGTWDDWMYGNRSAIALTCEIYGNATAWKRRPGPQPNTYWLYNVLEVFNPPAEEIQSVIMKWLPVLTYISNRTVEENPPRGIAVTGFTVNPNEAYKGWLVEANLEVQNFAAQTQNFDITIGTANHTLAVLTNCQANPNSKINMTLALDTSDLEPCETYCLWAETSTFSNETVSENCRFLNVTLKTRLTGDVDDDGKVSIIDIVIIATHFGRWCWPCDLNRDGKVNMEDIESAAECFGESCQR